MDEPMMGPNETNGVAIDEEVERKYEPIFNEERCEHDEPEELIAQGQHENEDGSIITYASFACPHVELEDYDVELPNGDTVTLQRLRGCDHEYVIQTETPIPEPDPIPDPIVALGKRGKPEILQPARFAVSRGKVTL